MPMATPTRRKLMLPCVFDQNERTQSLYIDQPLADEEILLLEVLPPSFLTISMRSGSGTSTRRSLIRRRIT